MQMSIVLESEIQNPHFIGCQNLLEGGVQKLCIFAYCLPIFDWKKKHFPFVVMYYIISKPDR